MPAVGRCSVDCGFHRVPLDLPGLLVLQVCSYDGLGVCEDLVCDGCELECIEGEVA